MIEFQLPEHTSHSAISSYLRCQKAYELKKLGVQETPSWWLLGGSAVHTATEWLDKGEWDGPPEDAFYEAFYNEIYSMQDIDPDQSKWRKAGYGARAQGWEHWMQQGPRYVKQWAGKEYSWHWVELDVSTTLPSGIIIKGFIDRVKMLAHGNDFRVVDLKTGSARPDSDQQLGIYSALLKEYASKNFALEEGHDFIVEASNYMFKDDEFYPMDVSNWTLETVDEIAKEWYSGISSGVFIPNRGKQCGTCGVAGACYLAAGDTDLSRSYDRLNPRHGE